MTNKAREAAERLADLAEKFSGGGEIPMIDLEYMTAGNLKDAAEDMSDLQAPFASAARELRRALRDEDLQAMKARTA